MNAVHHPVMMEDNTISMFMDVKLDIRERKLEFSHMKSWSRYFVRVEAVKCFPCYMRISFFSSPTDLNTDLIVRINIPGLTVQMATSRTKQHSYGLFWKNNRKRCCAYFALETQLLCERHLRWMKKSIRNLELYRQDMMQLRRASRTPLYEIRQEMQPLDPPAVATVAARAAVCDDMGIYQNLDNTQNIMDLQDILGPLPTVPVVERQADSSIIGANNWSRRVSGMSGIYEEIRDDLASGSSRLSRASIASGIYEEMKLVTASEPIMEELSTPPPPLPPRKRLNTNEDFDLQRSYTAPEVELMKKKRHHWLRLESMFGRKRTTSTDSQGSTSAKKNSNRKENKTETKPSSSPVVHRDKVNRLRLGENKRNSFSSPDLSRLKISNVPAGFEDGDGNVSCDNLSDGVGSCTSEFYLQHDIDYIEEDCCFGSSEYINMSGASISSEPPAEACEKDRNHHNKMFGSVLSDIGRLNISEHVFDSFNRSVNSSTVNLAGCVAAMDGSVAECRVERPPPIKESELDGYLEMGPIGTGFNRQKLLLDEAVIYRNSPLPPPEGLRSGCVQQQESSEESIYMSMGGTEGKLLHEPIRSSSTSSSSSSSSSGVSSASEQSYITSQDGAGKQRCSVDDKIPSYYPNADIQRTPPSAKSKCIERDNMTPPTVATTLPRTVRSAQRATSQVAMEAHDRVDASFRTPKGTGRRLRTSHGTTRLQTKEAASNGSECSSKLFQKYATLARISSSPSRGEGEDAMKVARSEKPSPSPATTPISKRFGSLPRFGKIDLSPLRMKINSVLQRHNSGNL
uniref:PH domain-containing protein n=1 Tax=Anopheles epiroticus TaxID=199890 RepID=A0A182PIB6_9DIPT